MSYNVEIVECPRQLGDWHIVHIKESQTVTCNYAKWNFDSCCYWLDTFEAIEFCVGPDINHMEACDATVGFTKMLEQATKVTKHCNIRHEVSNRQATPPVWWVVVFVESDGKWYGGWWWVVALSGGDGLGGHWWEISGKYNHTKHYVEGAYSKQIKIQSSSEERIGKNIDLCDIRVCIPYATQGFELMKGVSARLAATTNFQNWNKIYWTA